MLDELKNYQPKERIKHATRALNSISELAKIMDEQFVFLPRGENVYEMVQVKSDGSEITHIQVKTPLQEAEIDVSEQLQESLLYGQIRIQVTQPDTNIHNLPLPIYNIDYFNGQIMPCVELKTGQRAMAGSEFYIGMQE